MSKDLSHISKKQLEELQECVEECISKDSLTEESLQKLQDNIKICTSNVPTTITVKQFKKLVDHINNRFNVFVKDENGNDTKEIDFNKCQRNVAYSISNWFTNYNGLLLKEQQKLAEIGSELSLIKAKAYDDIKMTKVKYDLDVKGMALMLEGHELVRPKQIEYDKQKVYIKYLENAVKQIGNYATGIKRIIEIEDQKLRYGA